MYVSVWRRPEVGFYTTAVSVVAVNWNVVEGALQWATLILGVLVGLLTLVRLVRELGWFGYGRSGSVLPASGGGPAGHQADSGSTVNQIHRTRRGQRSTND